jgi:hypothetical protein
VMDNGKIRLGRVEAEVILGVYYMLFISDNIYSYQISD